MAKVFLVIFFVAFPEYKDKIIEESRKAMEEQDRTDEEIDMAMGMMQRSFVLFAAAGADAIYCSIHNGSA